MNLSIQNKITETDTDQVIGSEEIDYVSTGPGSQRVRRSIATSEVNLAIDAAILAGNDPGLCYIKNLDASNYLEVGIATGVYIMRIPPLQSQTLWLTPSATNVFLKANTAAVEADIFIWER